eukprot:856165-Alexandrium_andersonii.AAC.1
MGSLKRGVATHDEAVDGGGPVNPAASSTDGPIIPSPAMRVAMSSSVMTLFNMIRSLSGASTTPATDGGPPLPSGSSGSSEPAA